MIRMLGVLCGAAIAIVLLTWLVGVPQFTSEREQVGEPMTVVALRDLEAETETPADTADAGPAERVPPVPEPLAELDTPSPSTETVVPDAPNPLDAQAHAASVSEPFADSVAERIADPVAEPIAEPFAEPQWFAFWTPFRSEIAANGFVGRLQSVTGLDYRVVKVKPGVYEVAFAYSEDTEIDSNLSTISAATGLDLPGAQ